LTDAQKLAWSHRMIEIRLFEDKVLEDRKSKTQPRQGLKPRHARLAVGAASTLDALL
jgi:hypothetical protein